MKDWVLVIVVQLPITTFINVYSYLHRPDEIKKKIRGTEIP
jgi:hypothetical protein